MSEIQFHDGFIQIGLLTMEKYLTFQIATNEDRPYEYDDNVMFMIRYEMDLNSWFIERVIYDVLDYLGDIGGFKEALSLITFAILLIL